MINDKLEIANFELRNWEPARRVGVRRTISNLKKHRAESEESGARTQNSGFSVQGGWRFQVSVFRFQLLCFFFLTPDTRHLVPVLPLTPDPPPAEHLKP
jgi:hypothetical protein